MPLSGDRRRGIEVRCWFRRSGRYPVRISPRLQAVSHLIADPFPPCGQGIFGNSDNDIPKPWAAAEVRPYSAFSSSGVADRLQPWSVLCRHRSTMGQRSALGCGELTKARKATGLPLRPTDSDGQFLVRAPTSSTVWRDAVCMLTGLSCDA